MARWIHFINMLVLGQASLLSLLPPELLKITEVPKLTINALFPLVKWFHRSFHAQNSSINEGFLKSNLETALGSQEGSFEEIFAEKPAVHQAFLHFVPNKMSEKDFWTKYCRVEYPYAAVDEELAIFLKCDDILANEARREVVLQEVQDRKDC